MQHAHAQSFFQELALVCLLVKLPSFRPSQSMFKFINAEITQKRELSECAKK